jgi:hypothetical protein
LEVDVRGASMLINNESIIKERMLQLISIGYNKRMTEMKKIKQSKLGKAVMQFGADGQLIKVHTEGMRATERKLGLTSGSISHAVRLGNKAGGFYWIKEDDYKNRQK